MCCRAIDWLNFGQHKGEFYRNLWPSGCLTGLTSLGNWEGESNYGEKLCRDIDKMSPQKLEAPNSFCCTRLLCAKSRSALAAFNMPHRDHCSSLPLAARKLQELSEEKKFICFSQEYGLPVSVEKHCENKLEEKFRQPYNFFKQVSEIVLGFLSYLNVFSYCQINGSARDYSIYSHTVCSQAPLPDEKQQIDFLTFI